MQLLTCYNSRRVHYKIDG